MKNPTVIEKAVKEKFIHDSDNLPLALNCNAKLKNVV